MICCIIYFVKAFKTFFFQIKSLLYLQLKQQNNFLASKNVAFTFVYLTCAEHASSIRQRWGVYVRAINLFGFGGFYIVDLICC